MVSSVVRARRVMGASNAARVRRVRVVSNVARARRAMGALMPARRVVRAVLSRVAPVRLHAARAAAAHVSSKQ